MMNNIILPLCFKGNRTYLHGTDIYNALASALVQSGIVDISDPLMTIHKRSTHQLLLRGTTVGDASIDAENITAQFLYTSGAKRKKLILIESGLEVDCRYPYDEEQITASTRTDINTQTISLDVPLPYSDIEIITAMNKELLNKLFPGISGKWFMTRFQAKAYFKNTLYKTIQLKLEHNLNFKLTKSSIWVDDESYGYVFFSLN